MKPTASLAALGALSALLLGPACGGDDARTTTYFDLPTALSVGGPVLASPVVQPVYFSGYGNPEETDAFLSALTTSNYWATVTSDYGVGPLRALPGYRPTFPLPASLTEKDLPGLLAQALQEGQTLAMPGNDTVYALFFPTSTTISYLDVTLCGVGHPEGYHDEWTAGGTRVPVVIVPGCASSSLDGDLKGVDIVTPVLTHELVEAATDPYVNSAPAYRALDAGHAFWGQALGGSEVADLCENEVPSTVTLPELGHPAARIWSNLAAQADRGPCVPVPAGEAYFNAIADLPDTTTLTDSRGTQVKVPVLAAGVGRDVSARVHFRGEKGAPSQWKIVAFEIDDPTHPIPAHPGSGVVGGRGVTTDVAVTAEANSQAGLFPLVVLSTDGTAFHFWVGGIQRR